MLTEAALVTTGEYCFFWLLYFRLWLQYGDRPLIGGLVRAESFEMIAVGKNCVTVASVRCSDRRRVRVAARK